MLILCIPIGSFKNFNQSQFDKFTLCLTIAVHQLKKSLSAVNTMSIFCHEVLSLYDRNLDSRKFHILRA